MRKLNFLIIIGFLTSGFIIGGISWVCAQEDEFTLEEITVTAQKREENQQKVPIAMESLSGDEIASMGGTTFKDTLNTLSSVTIQQNNESLSISIRGMDNDGGSADFDGMIGITLDGVTSNNFATGFSGFYDVSRVEVLSGPQGTLYSRNSGGGVVNMITNNPNTEGFDATGLIEIGNFNTLNTQGAINVPLNEEAAIRLAFSTTDRDGYLDNGTDDNKSKSMRFKYLYNFNEDLSAIFTYENVRATGKGQGRYGAKPFGDEDEVTDPWSGLYDGEYYATDMDSKKYAVTLTSNTGIGQLTFIPSYTALDRVFDTPQIDRGTGGIMINHCIDEQREYSHELRMNSSEDSFMTWVAGLYAYGKKWDDDASSPTDYNTNDNKNVSRAAFANLTYPISDRLRVTGGGRYTKDHNKMEVEVIKIATGLTDMYRYYEGRTNHFDYKLGMEYDLSENSMIWLDNSTGYNQGYGGNKSQTLMAYQVGSKNRFFNQRIQVNASAYYYDYENYEVMSMEDYTGPDGVVMMDMGTGTGSATVYGLDIDTDFLITHNDSLVFAASYMHSEIRDLTIYYDYSPPNSLYNSSPINNSPTWTLNGSYKHDFFLANGGAITAGIDLRYRTKYFCSMSVLMNDADDPMNWEPAHHMTNASLNYASPGGKWNVNAYVKNIENHAEKVGVSQNSSLNLSYPRSYGVVLSLKY